MAPHFEDGAMAIIMPSVGAHHDVDATCSCCPPTHCVHPWSRSVPVAGAGTDAIRHVCCAMKIIVLPCLSVNCSHKILEQDQSKNSLCANQLWLASRPPHLPVHAVLLQPCSGSVWDEGGSSSTVGVTRTDLSDRMLLLSNAFGSSGIMTPSMQSKYYRR